MERLCDLLHIVAGITAVIGSGGKTSLLSALSLELGGSVILTTSTRIFPFANIPTANPASTAQAKRCMGSARVVCFGERCEKGKLGAPQLSFEEMAACATYVLVEADGSHHLPLKAHAAHEPAFPTTTCSKVLVVGASGFNQPIGDAVHRPEIFRSLVGIDSVHTDPDAMATPKRVAIAVAAEDLADTIFVNQMDDDRALTQTQAFRAALGRSLVAGSLMHGSYRLM